MIERFIKNDISLKKWRAFKARKLSWYSLIAILVMCFFSFTAEFWSNSKPIYLSYEGKFFHSLEREGQQHMLWNFFP